MRGFPKHFNTKYDVEHCLEYYPEETKAFLTQKLAEVKQWLVTEKLVEGDVGKTDKTHKVVEIKDKERDKVTERYQYEYKDDPNCQLFRLGFTENEVIQLIENIKS